MCGLIMHGWAHARVYNCVGDSGVVSTFVCNDGARVDCDVLVSHVLSVHVVAMMRVLVQGLKLRTNSLFAQLTRWGDGMPCCARAMHRYVRCAMLWRVERVTWLYSYSDDGSYT